MHIHTPYIFINSCNLGSTFFFFLLLLNFKFMSSLSFLTFLSSYSGISSISTFTLLGLTFKTAKEFVLSRAVFIYDFILSVFVSFFDSLRLILEDVSVFFYGDLYSALMDILGTLLELVILLLFDVLRLLVRREVYSFFPFFYGLLRSLSAALGGGGEVGKTSTGLMVFASELDAPQPMLILFNNHSKSLIQVNIFIQLSLNYIIIMENTSASEQASVADIQHNDHDNPREQSFMQRHYITITTVVKTIIAFILFAVLIWVVAMNVENALIKAKRQSKYHSQDQVREISGLDQQTFRTYYFYKQMVQLAKNNTAKEKKFDATLSHQFDGVTFSELFGIFKVVKAIQYAKNYNAFPQAKQQEVVQYGQSVDPQILQKPYNYTQYFLPASNQYQCASCYSFPITATIEYMYRKYLNITVKLSEQQLIDCSADDQTVDGCNEGNITKGFQYAVKIGLVEQSQYPYRSKNGKSFPCRKEIIANPQIKKYKIDGFRLLPKDNCQAIKYELSRGNVVASMIAVGQLPEYTEIETAPFRNCPKEPFNHAITIVGQTEQDEWIIRNSWGSSWGKNGYFIMRGNNTCGICTHSIIPYLNNTIASSP